MRYTRFDGQQQINIAQPMRLTPASGEVLLRADRGHDRQRVDTGALEAGLHDRFAVSAASDRLKPQGTPSFDIRAAP